MRKSTCITTSNHNIYYYNILTTDLFYLHPIVFYHYKKDFNINIDIDINVDISKYSKKELYYYKRKYFFLKKHSKITAPNIDRNENINRLISTLSSQSVRTQIANLKQLTFEITELCNFNCTYCAYGDLYDDYGNRVRKKLSFNIIKPFLDKLIEIKSSILNNGFNKIFYISFYGGEPLLNFEFIEKVVKYFSSIELNEKIKFSITTNGWYILKYIDFFVTHDFNILISLDGNQKDNIYRKLKSGKQTYKKVFENIKYIQLKYKSFFEKNVNFNSVLTDKNIDSDIDNYFLANFNKTPSKGTLNNSGINPEKKDVFEKMYKTLYLEKKIIHSPFNNRYRNIHEFLRFKLKLQKKSLYEFFEETQQHKHYPTGTCLPFSKKMFITAQGKILPCERIGHRFMLGKIRLGENEINLDYNKIAQKYSLYFTKMKKLCSKCYRKNNCSQCMFFLDIENKSIKCDSYQNINDLEKELKYFISEIENTPSVIQSGFEKINYEL